MLLNTSYSNNDIETTYDDPRLQPKDKTGGEQQ